MASNQQIVKKIVDVNPDCLEHVFNYLEMKDLVNVANSNAYLRNVAVEVFKRKITGKTIEIDRSRFSAYDETEFYTRYLYQDSDHLSIRKPLPALRVLRLFGETILSIKMCGWREESSTEINEMLFKYVNQYCSETLKSFAIKCHYECDCECDSVFSYVQAENPYKSVEEVSINCTILEFEKSQFSKTFPELRRLELNNRFPHNYENIVQRFDKLEHLKIKTNENGFTIDDIKSIIGLNCQLQSLSLGDFSLDLWNSASKQLKQLRTLEIVDGENEKLQVHQINFESVMRLNLNIPEKFPRFGYYGGVMARNLLFFRQLKELNVSSFENTPPLELILKNPNIVKLDIRGEQYMSLSPKNMGNLIKGLRKIKEMELTKCECSTETVYDLLKNCQSIRKFSMTRENQNFGNIPNGWKASGDFLCIVFEKK